MRPVHSEHACRAFPRCTIDRTYYSLLAWLCCTGNLQTVRRCQGSSLCATGRWTERQGNRQTGRGVQTRAADDALYLMASARSGAGAAVGRSGRRTVDRRSRGLQGRLPSVRRGIRASLATHWTAIRDACQVGKTRRGARRGECPALQAGAGCAACDTRCRPRSRTDAAGVAGRSAARARV